MRLIFKIIWNLLALLGLLTLVGVGYLTYLWFSNPFLQELFTPTAVFNNEEVAKADLDQHPGLSADQEKSLQSVGVDVSKLPTEITPGMEECFVEKLGQERVDQIVAGSSPTPVEFLKTQECLSL